MNELFIRPTYRAWGIYEMIGVNRAEIIFEGTREECYAQKDRIEKERTEAKWQTS